MQAQLEGKAPMWLTSIKTAWNNSEEILSRGFGEGSSGMVKLMWV